MSRGIEIFTWEDFDRAIDFLSGIGRRREFKHIYGVPRGGLIPAVALSHRLGLPMVIDPGLINKSTLVVDDISDSGHTLRMFAHAGAIVTIHVVHGTETMPDMFLAYRRAEWVQYPWERE